MDLFEQDSGSDNLTSTFFPADDLTGDDTANGPGGDQDAPSGPGGTGDGPNGPNGDGGDSQPPPPDPANAAPDPPPNPPTAQDPGPFSPPPADPFSNPLGNASDPSQYDPPPSISSDPSSGGDQVQTLWGPVNASTLSPNALGGPDVLGINATDPTAPSWQNEPFSSQFVPPPPIVPTPPPPMPSFQPCGAPFGSQDMFNANLANSFTMNGFDPSTTASSSDTGPAIYGVATAQGTINTVDPTSDPGYTGPGTFFTPNPNPPPDAASLAV